MIVREQVAHRKAFLRELRLGADEQDVLCIDERQVSVRSKWMNQRPDPSSEGVWDNQRAAFMANRPTTGAVRPRG